VSSLDAVGAYARKNGVEALGLADATRRLKGGRGLVPDLDALVSWRNSVAHGGAPRSPAEADESVQEIVPRLNSALEGSTALASAQWTLVHRADWDRHRSLFDVAGRSLTGDHPDHEWIDFTSPQPLAPDLVYVRSPEEDELVLLHPLIAFGVCQTCRNEEIYYVDRILENRAVMRSFTTGHKLDSNTLHEELANLVRR
jgi:type I restriction enzyme M protein